MTPHEVSCKYSPLALAYIGDSVFEVYMREKILKRNIVRVEQLQKEVTKYVSAKGQAKALNELVEKNVLTDAELDIVKRGRNYKRSTHPHHTDVVTYKYATGLEALIGYLYLKKDVKRLKEILDEIEVNTCISVEKMS